jgi:hypothetical protein
VAGIQRTRLEEACDTTVQLAERLKFQAIVASNLDEFFMVRVAGLKQLVAGGVVDVNADGMPPAEQLARIGARTHDMVRALYQNWRGDIAPNAGQQGGHRLGPAGRSHPRAASRPANPLSRATCGPCSRRWPWIRGIPFRRCATAA